MQTTQNRQTGALKNRPLQNKAQTGVLKNRPHPNKALTAVRKSLQQRLAQLRMVNTVQQLTSVIR